MFVNVSTEYFAVRKKEVAYYFGVKMFTDLMKVWISKDFGKHCQSLCYLDISKLYDCTICLPVNEFPLKGWGTHQTLLLLINILHCYNY